MALKHYLKGIFSVRKHHIMVLSTDNAVAPIADGLNLFLVKDHSDVVDGTYGRAIQINLMKKNEGLCEQYVLKNGQDDIVGTLSVMYKGGNELEYCIRNIDAFVYNLFVRPKFRGKGYAGVMLSLLYATLKKKEINEIWLAVSTDNADAIKAYTRIGFKAVCDRVFIRTLRKNFPYYVL